MRRRDFVKAVGVAAAWPLAAAAQPPAVPVIGYLRGGPPIASILAGFRNGLNERGYAEGRNLAIEFRDTVQYDRFPALAAELVRRRVAVIFIQGNVNAVQAAKAATATTPIVFATGVDPVEAGLVASLARPGGNVTGVTFLNTQLELKRLELLRELLPQSTTIAFLVNPTLSATERNIRAMQAVAHSFGQNIIVCSASTASGIDAAFAGLVEKKAAGLLVGVDTLFVSRRDQLVALAARHRLRSIYFQPEFTAAGGLMSYSDDRVESYRQAGLYVGRILKGEKPADLPVLQPTKFEFAINLKTAKALGIEFPRSFLLRADTVIE